jgi:signal transduction histidine kinase
MNSSTAAPSGNLLKGGFVGALALIAATLAMVPMAIRGMLSAGRFLPHSVCYLNDRQLIALNVGTDAAIWLSYVAISCTLVYLVWRTRREVPFSWMFLAFGLFIVACGFTHFMEIVVLWRPLYWLAGDVKLVTAFASLVTAVALPGLIPQIHSMVTAAHVSEDRRLQLENANLELQKISSRVMEAQDDERRRVARELHDGIGQYLMAIKMSCEFTLENFKGDPRVEPLSGSLKLLDQCTAEVRTMSHLLHPPLLEEVGLASAIPWYAEGFAERSGIKVNIQLPRGMDRLAQNLELVLFRVLQESLTNIHRHSGSKMAKIALVIEGRRAVLTIADDGQGFAPVNGHPHKFGVGIASMRERVRELGGELQITSGANGTMVEAALPLNQAPPTVTASDAGRGTDPRT